MFEFIIKILGTKEIDLTKYVKDALPRYVLKIMYEVQHIDVNFGDDCFLCDILHLH